MEVIIDNTMDRLLRDLKQKLWQEDKSNNTTGKYLHDVRDYLVYTGSRIRESMPQERLVEERIFSESSLREYRAYLADHYMPAGVNSRISAINCFLRLSGRADLRMKQLKVQKTMFRSAGQELSRDEYFRLLRAAQKKRNQRMFLLMQTIASTGIRVSEIPFITVESAREKRTCIRLKGKVRTVLLPAKLCGRLLQYAKEHHIRQGMIFVTKSGLPVNRSNIARDMKKICAEAHVQREKVFPHNFRHLFAVTYYRSQKDLSHLADILGHSNINTTRIYTSVSSDEHRKQIEKINLML